MTRRIYWKLDSKRLRTLASVFSILVFLIYSFFDPTRSVWLMCAAITGLLFSFLGHLLHLLRVPRILLSISAGLSAIALLFAYQANAQMTPVEIRIVSPSDNSRAESALISVSGTVRPADARVTLMVSGETDERWWIQSIIVSQSRDGNHGVWSINAHLGEPVPSKPENFQIIAMASGDSRLFNLITGRVIWANAPRTTLPQWITSQPVVIRREH